MRSATVSAALALLAIAAVPARVSAIGIVNGSFELGPGPTGTDPHIPANWTRFGPTVERSDEANLTPAGAGHALKAFASDPTVGAYQQIPAGAGNALRISANLYTRATDQIGGTADAGIVLEFYDSGATLLGSTDTFPLNASSPADTWIPASVGPVTAPVGTTAARIVCVWRTNSGGTGSAYWDGCSLTINNGANLLNNGNFETAAMGTQSPFGLDGWTGFNDQEKSAEIAYDGNFGLKLGPGAPFSGVFQNFGTLNAGDHVCMTARGIVRSANPLTGAAQVGIKLEFLPTSAVPPPVENLPFNNSTTPDTWQQVQLNLTVPAGISIARIDCIYAGNFSATGSVYYDAISAIRGSNPGNNVLSNSSFESGLGGQGGIDGWVEFNTPGQSQAELSIGEVPAFDGTRTMKARGTAIAGIYQEISVTPGESLAVTVRMRTPATDHITNATAGIKVEWSPGTLPANIEQFTLNSSSPHDVWIPLKIDFTMPAGTSAIGRFTNLYFRGSGGGYAYMDACALVVNRNFDADQNGRIDLRDYSVLQRCFSGNGNPDAGAVCDLMDSDCDSDVDLFDYADFRMALTGP